MPNASKTDLNEIDETFSPANVPVAISGMVGCFKRGPIADPSIIITSWTQFSKIFGGLVAGVDDSMIAKRALERGSQLRVVNIRHYTDPSQPGTLTALVATPATGKTITLSGVLITANTLQLTINGVVVSQIFTATSDNTFNLLVQKIQQTAPLVGVISKISYLGANKLIVTPATGVVLTITGTNTGGAGQAAVTVASVSTILNGAGNPLFSLVPKYAGFDYNNLQVDILPASNGNANYFDIQIEHLLEPNLNESYKNIIINGAPTVANSNYLQAIVNGSQLMNVTYADLSAIAPQIRPVNTYLKYDSGTDGAGVVDSDFLGDSGAKTGVFALDPYDDLISFGSANSNSLAVIQAYSAYAQNRQDLRFFAHIDNSFTTEAAVAAFRDSTLVDSSYTGFFAGGVKITDPFTLAPRNISEIGDVLGAAAFSGQTFGLWYSFAGTRRGTIVNALGVVNNFGLASNYNGRNLLANHQVNLAINKSGKTQISGNFTGQLLQSTLSFMNVRGMLLFLKKTIGPVFDSYIEEPNDPTTWLAIYSEIKPILKTLKDKRGIADSNYQGDQFVTNIDNCVINDPDDVQNGKYVVNLFVKDIVSLQWIQVNIILTNSGVSFEDVLSPIGDSTNQ